MKQTRSLLRFVTSGSVDDGKSTLIGRLLYETKSIFEDQFEAIRNTSSKKGQEEVDLSLLLDGLAAEREQAITIDVAYRYFATPNRKFIIADSPGHEQYTRNMVTGASTSDLAIILIDARKGVVTQSKRHGFLVSLLRIPHLIVAVNKMDLVDYSQDIYQSIVDEYSSFSEKLDVHDIVFVPVSALKGDNIIERSPKTPWYNGHTLLHYLENVHIAADRNLIDFRFPVQYVVRPHLDFRGFAGRVTSGTIRVGEEVAVLPSGKTTSVTSIITYDNELDEAVAGQSVVLRLKDEIDISRGDMIIRKNNLPQIDTGIEAIICWMSETPLQPHCPYILRHTTRSANAFVTKILYRIDVNTLHREKVNTLELNEIGRIELKSSLPLFFDTYRNNKGTGSFILIDPLTNGTVAAGMIRGAIRSIADIQEPPSTLTSKKVSPHTQWNGATIPLEFREKVQNHKAAVLWFTGLSGSGKSTIAKALEKMLFEQRFRTVLLDGDNMRHGLCGDLGFTEEDRNENIRRVGEVAKLFFENGTIVLCTFISPSISQREFVRSLIPQGRFFEIFVRCDLDVCKRRDPKGLYKKALNGEIKEFTGVSSPYEEPGKPEIVVETDVHSIGEIADTIIQRLQSSAIL